MNQLFFIEDLKLFASNQNETDSLVRTLEIVTKNIGMKFGLDKFGVLTMKSGKELKGDGIVTENIGPIGEEEYKYFGSLKKGDICQEEMKKNIRKECLKRLKSTLKLKLNAKHVLQATNTWVVPNVR